MPKKQNLEDLKRIYKYTLLSDEQFSDFYNEALKDGDEKINETFHHLMMQYLKKNITPDIMKNYLYYNANGKSNQLFSFLNRIHYFLTVEDAEALLEEEVFQKMFSKKFSAKKEISYDYLEKYCKNDENLMCLVNIYLAKKNIEVVIGDSDEEKEQQKNIFSHEEVIELLKKTQVGDKDALNKIIFSNMGLVRMIANRYRWSNIEYEDLLQEGSVGLMTAALKFDVAKGYAFSTYATWWVRQAITRYMENNANTIRIPVHIKGKKLKLDKIRQKLIFDLGREPKIEEIAKASKVWNASQVQKIYDAFTKQLLSLDKTIKEDEDDTSLLNVLPDNKNVENEVIQRMDAQMILAQAKEILEERNYQVLLYRMGFVNNRAYTLEEVGQIFGVSRERIRQIEKKSLQKIANHIKFRKSKIEEQNKIQYSTFSILSIHKNLTFPIFSLLLQLFPPHEIKLYTKFRRIDLEKNKILPVKIQDYPENFLHYIEAIENDLKDMFTYYEKLGKKDGICEEEKAEEIKHYMYVRSIRFRYSKYKLKEIGNAINKLPSIYRRAIVLKHGKNLFTYKEFSEEETNLYSKNLQIAYKKIEDLLENRIPEIHPKSLQAKYLELSFEQLDGYVKQLSINQQDILYLRFGKKLNEYLSFPEDKKYQTYYRRCINACNALDDLVYGTAKIKKEEKIQGILELESKEDILWASEFLGPIQKAILFLRHGEDLDQTLAWPKAPENKCENYYWGTYYAMCKKVQYILKHKDEFILSSEQKVRNKKNTIIDKIPHEILIEIVSQLSQKQQGAMYLRHGEFLDKVLSWPNPPENKCANYWYVTYSGAVKRINTIYYKNYVEVSNVSAKKVIKTKKKKNKKESQSIQEQRQDFIETRSELEKIKIQNFMASLYEKYIKVYGRFITEENLKLIIEEAILSYSYDEGVSLEIASKFKIEKEIFLQLSNQYKNNPNSEQSLEILLLLEEIIGTRIKKHYFDNCPYSDNFISQTIENTLLNYLGNKSFYLNVLLTLRKF